jgi:hypothetical protein
MAQLIEGALRALRIRRRRETALEDGASGGLDERWHGVDSLDQVAEELS